MTFDYVSQFESEDAVLDYGCLYGNEKIVFIKVGLGGNYLGDESRYLKIARRLHEAHGCSVISVSNPYVENRRIDVENDRSILRDFMQKQNFQNPEPDPVANAAFIFDQAVLLRRESGGDKVLVKFALRCLCGAKLWE